MENFKKLRKTEKDADKEEIIDDYTADIMCRVLLVKTLRKTDSEANVWYRIKKR
jgi:hypothetical protein